MLINLPNVLLLQLAQEFLSSRDVVALGASATFPLRVLHAGYRRRGSYWVQVNEKENCMYVLDRDPRADGFSLEHSRIATQPLRCIPGTVVQSDSDAAAATATGTFVHTQISTTGEVATTTSPSKKCGSLSTVTSPYVVYQRSPYRIGLLVQIEISPAPPTRRRNSAEWLSSKVAAAAVTPAQKVIASQNDDHEEKKEEEEEEEEKKEVEEEDANQEEKQQHQEEVNETTTEEDINTDRNGEADAFNEDGELAAPADDHLPDAISHSSSWFTQLLLRAFQVLRCRRSNQAHEEVTLINDDEHDSALTVLEAKKDQETKLEDETEVVVVDDDDDDDEDEEAKSQTDEIQNEEDDLNELKLDDALEEYQSQVPPPMPPPAPIPYVRPNDDCYVLSNFDFLPSTLESLTVHNQLIPPPISSITRLNKLRRVLFSDTNAAHYSTPITDWPPALEHLSLRCESRDTLPTEEKIEAQIHLPEGVTDFTMMTKHFIPAAILEDKIEVKMHWPRSLTRLNFADSSSSPLSRWQLSNWLTKLQVIGSYNGQIDRLPASLETLDFSFSSHFNNSSLIEMTAEGWPQQLKVLHLHSFTQDISSMRLPHSLTELWMGHEYNRSFVGFTFPNSLKTLRLPSIWNQPELEHLSAILPLTLERLKLGFGFVQPLTGLTLPPRLTELGLGLAADGPMSEILFPESLTDLHLSSKYNQPAEDLRLPSQLKSLIFGVEWNQPPQQLRLPSSLTLIIFNSSFNQSLIGVTWPTSLMKLNFGDAFSHSLEGVDLPHSLEALSISYPAYAHPLADCIQRLPRLRNVWLCPNYVHAESLTHLPVSIQVNPIW